MNTSIEFEKKLAAKEAVKLLSDGQTVGLGSGSTAGYAIREIGKLVKNGLQIRAIPTSDHSRDLAASLAIPLVDINSVDTIDITIDGADEFDPSLDLIKGGGGALLREKIVAAMTTDLIIIVDSAKKVEVLGAFKLPIEVIPFASSFVLRRITNLNGEGTVRMAGATEYLTDEGNYIIDATFGPIRDPSSLATELNGIEGLVGHGLFVQMARKVIMGVDSTTKTFEADSARLHAGKRQA
ncbi:ribose-5-phosphate isomerase RpiA [Persicitalea jodogahamensis]|uniref:Ribose-5-phosphate isomerase A n=1 Tax=Persicitalea jodogahamensis TaxID=402147 RepID=A0A8J3D9G7_9BACT|nr:ribose-5-phosphate isomerase RpiA [Persicitalea jodogahamensis]GHB72119.1 ribose-5-phosphate isomerase A [Persicitalea jodogahamensis]